MKTLCPNCNQKYSIDKSDMGKTISCHTCETDFVLGELLASEPLHHQPRPDRQDHAQPSTPQEPAPQATPVQAAAPALQVQAAVQQSPVAQAAPVLQAQIPSQQAPDAGATITSATKETFQSEKAYPSQKPLHLQRIVILGLAIIGTLTSFLSVHGSVSWISQDGFLCVILFAIGAFFALLGKRRSQLASRGKFFIGGAYGLAALVALYDLDKLHSVKSATQALSDLSKAFGGRSLEISLFPVATSAIVGIAGVLCVLFWKKASN